MSEEKAKRYLRDDELPLDALIVGDDGELIEKPKRKNDGGDYGDLGEAVNQGLGKTAHIGAFLTVIVVLIVAVGLLAQHGITLPKLPTFDQPQPVPTAPARIATPGPVAIDPISGMFDVMNTLMAVSAPIVVAFFTIGLTASLVNRFTRKS